MSVDAVTTTSSVGVILEILGAVGMVAVSEKEEMPTFNCMNHVKESVLHNSQFSTISCLDNQGICLRGIRRGWNKHLLCLLVFVLFVRSYDTAMISSLPKASLNTTARTFSPCSRPPKECPNSDKDVSLHISCFYNYYGSMSCPEGYTYFCDPNSSGFLVENCFPQNSCPIGTNYIDFNIHNLTAKLACRPCQGNFTQPVPHDSAIYSSPGCIEPQLSIEMIRNLPKMHLVKDADSTGYPQYICDSSRGYSNIHGNMICNVSTLCECDDKVKCTNPSFPVLLPDGSCDRPCMKDREMMFKCQKYQPPTVITVQPVINFTSDNAQKNAQVTTDVLTSDETNPNLWWIIPLVLAVIAIAIAVIIAVICRRKLHSKSNEVFKSTKPEEEDLLKQNTDRQHSQQSASQSELGNQIAHPTDSNTEGEQASVGTSSFSQQNEQPERKIPAKGTGSLASSQTGSIGKDSSLQHCSFSGSRRESDSESNNSESNNLFSQDSRSPEPSEICALSKDCDKARTGGPNPDIRNDHSQINGKSISCMESDQSVQNDDQAPTIGIDQSILNSGEAPVVGSDRSLLNSGQAPVFGSDQSILNSGQAPVVGSDRSLLNSGQAPVVKSDQSILVSGQAPVVGSDRSLLNSGQAPVVGSDRSLPNGGQASVIGSDQSLLNGGQACDRSPVNECQASGIGNSSTRQNNYPASGSGSDHSQQNGCPVSGKVKVCITNEGGNGSLNIQDGQVTFNGPVKVSGNETIGYKVKNYYGTINYTYYLPPNQSKVATDIGPVQMKDLGTDYDVNKTDLKEDYQYILTEPPAAHPTWVYDYQFVGDKSQKDYFFLSVIIEV